MSDDLRGWNAAIRTELSHVGDVLCVTECPATDAYGDYTGRIFVTTWGEYADPRPFEVRTSGDAEKVAAVHAVEVGKMIARLKRESA